MNSFGLPDDVFAEIKDTLRGFPQIKYAKIFGSRAKGCHKRYSDVDIVVYSDEDSDISAEIEDALEDLDCIYYFDVLHYEKLTDIDVKAHIDRLGQKFYG